MYKSYLVVKIGTQDILFCVRTQSKDPYVYDSPDYSTYIIPDEIGAQYELNTLEGKKYKLKDIKAVNFDDMFEEITED